MVIRYCVLTVPQDGCVSVVGETMPSNSALTPVRCRSILIASACLASACFAFAVAPCAAQEGVRLDIPAPPPAGLDLSRMHYGSPVTAKPNFKIPLPPQAGVVVQDKDLAELSPFAVALRDLAEAGAKPTAAPPARKGRRQRAATVNAEALGLKNFYEARRYSPAWTTDGQWNRAARSVLTRLQRAGEDAIDLGLPVPAENLPANATAKILAEAEFQLSNAVVRYGQYASGGRIDPQRISSLITVKRVIPEAAAILQRISSAEFAGDALHAYNPPHAGYKALRAKLAELRGNSNQESHPPIAHGRILRVGMRDGRVPLIRSRFGLSNTGDTDKADIYDTQVAGAVAKFQRSRGLPANGRLTSATIKALSGDNRGRLVNEVLANMERWRWLPRDMGRTHVFVNIPEYTTRMLRDGAEIHSARVIVGKAKTPTPVFSDEMKFIVVNPYWNVPPSIIKKEMLPAYQRNSDYFSRRGYEMRTVRGQVVVRQPPGPRNALGYIKFLFPNRHAVYMHDTPSRGLFNASARAFSHGCVRVQDPFKFAGFVLNGQRGLSEKSLRRMIGGGERTIKLDQTIPVHLVYFTARVDESGELRLLGDIYGFSARLQRAMGLRS